MKITNRRSLRSLTLPAASGAAARVAACAALLLWMAFASAPSYASTSEHYALVFGTLWGAGGKPVYGVRMKLRRASEKKFRWEAVSDHRGEFAFRVPPVKADYVLVTDVKHPKDRPAPATNVHVDGDERVDIGVHLAEE